MTFDPALLDALEDLVIEWSGTIWRVVINGTDPFRPNQRGARWNPPFVEALYCSLEPETARTELEHVLAAQSVEVTRKRVVNELNARFERVVDLRDLNVLSNFGFGRDVMLGPDLELTRYLGEAMQWLGCAAAIVPSARHDGFNIVIFPSEMNPSDYLEPVEDRSD